MKRFLSLIALLLLAQTALCQNPQNPQNPRWRFAIPAPTQPNTAINTVTLLACDGAGGGVFLLTEAREAFEITSGAYKGLVEHILWLDRNGRLLHKFTRTGSFQYPPIVEAIGLNAVQIRLTLVEGTEDLVTRRLVRTARGVVSKDINPPLDETPATGYTFVSTADARGYFTIKTVPKDYVRTATHIVRYGP